MDFFTKTYVTLRVYKEGPLGFEYVWEGDRDENPVYVSNVLPKGRISETPEYDDGKIKQGDIILETEGPDGIHKVTSANIQDMQRMWEEYRPFVIRLQSGNSSSLRETRRLAKLSEDTAQHTGLMRPVVAKALSPVFEDPSHESPPEVAKGEEIIGIYRGLVKEPNRKRIGSPEERIFCVIKKPNGSFVLSWFEPADGKKKNSIPLYAGQKLPASVQSDDGIYYVAIQADKRNDGCLKIRVNGNNELRRLVRDVREIISDLTEKHSAQVKALQAMDAQKAAETAAAQKAAADEAAAQKAIQKAAISAEAERINQILGLQSDEDEPSSRHERFWGTFDDTYGFVDGGHGSGGSSHGHVRERRMPVRERRRGHTHSHTSHDEHMPVRERHMPVRERHMPVNDEHMPVRERHMPVRERHMPVNDEHMPVRERHMPVRERHMPVNDEHMPVRSSHNHRNHKRRSGSSRHKHRVHGSSQSRGRSHQSSHGDERKPTMDITGNGMIHFGNMKINDM